MYGVSPPSADMVLLLHRGLVCRMHGAERILWCETRRARWLAELLVGSPV